MPELVIPKTFTEVRLGHEPRRKFDREHPKWEATLGLGPYKKDVYLDRRSKKPKHELKDRLKEHKENKGRKRSDSFRN